MTITIKKTVFRTASGKLLEIAPCSGAPLSVDKIIEQRDAWYEKNKQYLDGYSVAEFLREKRRDIEKGLE